MSDYLGLINAVADIDIRDLGVGGGQAIDWPQICVVGGQSDGKSTLLSAVVSAKLSCQLDFLPEGKNRMVTRCPIVVQMLSPEGQFTHIAKVYNGENEAVPGAGQSEVECGGGADPSEDDLKAWGTAIKAKIDANQDLNEPTGKNVTAKKVIVRLTGPRMQNLSLVDLPGLRQVDEPSNRGLKDKVERLVKASVTSNSSIVLAVVRAEQDKANWVGLGVAREVDPHEDRTIAVVTKVDRIFKTEVPDETDRGNRDQINRVMGEDGNIEYYAAYNPPEGDATALPQCFAQQVAEAFPEGHVGNEAIAAGLTEKLTDLLGNQLPALHKKFEARAMALRQELKVPFQPSWEMVEHVALLYGMFVETYALGKIPEGALCSYTDFFDDDGELFPSALKRIINEFKQQNEPQKVYSAPGAQRTILCMDTEAARKQVLSFRVQAGDDADEERPDHKVAEEIGKLVSLNLSISNSVLDVIEHQVIPLVTKYYAAVAQVRFRVPMPNGTEWESSVSGYGRLMQELHDATQHLLSSNATYIKHQISAKDIKVRRRDVEEQFLTFAEVKDALTRVCRFHIDQAMAPSSPAPVATQPSLTRGLSRQLSTAHVVPPYGLCCKQKPTLKTWPERFVKIIDDGIFVYTKESDMQHRATSIPDLNGCTVMKSEEDFTFSAKQFAIRIFKSNLNPPQANFIWKLEADRDRFYDAIYNLSKGREWNQSEAEATAMATAEAERQAAEAAAAQQAVIDAAIAARDAQEAAQGPEPEPESESTLIEPATERPETTDEEMRVLIGGETRQDKQRSLSQLLDIGSGPFNSFYQQLKRNPIGSAVQAKLDDEIEAEAFRLWAMKYVMTSVAAKLKIAERELESKFLAVSGLNAPFSAVAIFKKFGLAKMVLGHTSGDQMFKDKSPAHLLVQASNVSNKEHKERSLATLEEILKRFAAHGFRASTAS